MCSLMKINYKLKKQINIWLWKVGFGIGKDQDEFEDWIWKKFFLYRTENWH